MNAVPLAAALSTRIGGSWRAQALDRSAFCRTFRADAPGHEPLFVKTLPAERAEVLHAEADGLQALAATRTIRVPRVLDAVVHDGVAVLAMQWLEFAPSTASPAFAERFGHALASLHRAAPPGDGRFGWHRDNWLGGTPQRNACSASTGRDGWLAFLAERRLLAMAEGLGEPLDAAVRRVVDMLPRLFDADGHVPRPSLIHGDLWSGNWGSLAGGEPVIFDPAVSVSDAEAELAMMELFGSPPAGFWPAYRERMPVAPGYPRRRPVYQLVHLLNHARLFGGGYGRQALAVAQVVVRGA